MPLLVQTHREHAEVMHWSKDKELALCGHALAETYSVLTRLPGDLRLEPVDAARLLRERFARPIVLRAKSSESLVETLSRLGVAGGAVYDGLVALAAVDQGTSLATRDLRAKPTYELVGASVLVAA